MNKIELLCILSIILLVVSMVGFICLYAYATFDRDDYTVTVTDKGVKRYNSSDKYLVYTDKGTFEMTDTLVHLRYDTSDEYAKIKVGTTYDIVTYGVRIPFFNMYENILEFKEIKTTAE